MEHFRGNKTLYVLLILVLHFNIFEFSLHGALYGRRFVKLLIPIEPQTEKNEIYNQLIDLKDFKFLINSQECDPCQSDFFLIAIIHNSPSNYEQRTVIRQTWGKAKDCFKAVFMIGVTNDMNVTNRIREESERYGDIVQGNFIDSYRNLTYKHVMGLTWVSQHCTRAKYIVKTDDDTVVNIDLLYDMLKGGYWGSKGLIACAVFYSGQVLRKDSKWAVTEEEYPGENYPDYCTGSYQPSNELMLRFYSYFKQATEGPCDKPKPGFWDVVNRAKWESWNKLGNMTKEEAMQAYVDELHKIVETMSYNSDVASFLSVDDEDAEFPSGALQLVAGDVLARVRSEHNTPVCSRSVSGASSPRAASPSPRTRHDSDDEFIDTVDSDPEPAPEPVHRAPRLSNGHAHQITSQLTHLKVLEQLPGTLARLEADVAALRKAVEGDRRMLDASGKWRWPWQELSTPTLIFVFVWPFVAYRLAARLQRRNT